MVSVPEEYTRFAEQLTSGAVDLADFMIAPNEAAYLKLYKPAKRVKKAADKNNEFPKLSKKYTKENIPEIAGWAGFALENDLCVLQLKAGPDFDVIEWFDSEVKPKMLARAILPRDTEFLNEAICTILMFVEKKLASMKKETGGE